MIKLSKELQNILKVKGPTSSQFLRIFTTFKRDLNRAWQTSDIYRSNPLFRKYVYFLVKFDSNKGVKVTLVVRTPEIKEEEEEEIAIKTQKLLYSKKKVDKVGGIEMRYLAPIKRDRKPTTAEKREDSYRSTLRQQAQAASDKLKKKKDFGVKRAASTWGTGGRKFDTNRIAKTWGTGGKTIREPKKVIRWGTKTEYKNPRKNVRWGTSKKMLDQDTNKSWGTESVKKKKILPRDDKTILKYKKFIYALHRETFIEKLFKEYGSKLRSFLISNLQ